MYTNRPKKGIKSNEKFYNVKCAITNIYDVSSFYWNIKSIVMEMALVEIFCSYYANIMTSHW